LQNERQGVAGTCHHCPTLTKRKIYYRNSMVFIFKREDGCTAVDEKLCSGISVSS
jgi:hypothetical protein